MIGAGSHGVLLHDDDHVAMRGGEAVEYLSGEKKFPFLERGCEEEWGSLIESSRTFLSFLSLTSFSFSNDPGSSLRKQ